jgi:hypothetical protein
MGIVDDMVVWDGEEDQTYIELADQARRDLDEALPNGANISVKNMERAVMDIAQGELTVLQAVSRLTNKKVITLRKNG